MVDMFYINMLHVNFFNCIFNDYHIAEVYFYFHPIPKTNFSYKMTSKFQFQNNEH